jgi:hypothetical protein
MVLASRISDHIRTPSRLRLPWPREIALAQSSHICKRYTLTILPKSQLSLIHFDLWCYIPNTKQQSKRIAESFAKMEAYKLDLIIRTVPMVPV